MQLKTEHLHTGAYLEGAFSGSEPPFPGLLLPLILCTLVFIYFSELVFEKIQKMKSNVYVNLSWLSAAGKLHPTVLNLINSLRHPLCVAFFERNEITRWSKYIIMYNQ